MMSGLSLSSADSAALRLRTVAANQRFAGVSKLRDGTEQTKISSFPSALARAVMVSDHRTDPRTELTQR